MRAGTGVPGPMGAPGACGVPAERPRSSQPTGQEPQAGLSWRQKLHPPGREREGGSLSQLLRLVSSWELQLAETLLRLVSNWELQLAGTSPKLIRLVPVQELTPVLCFLVSSKGRL